MDSEITRELRHTNSQVREIINLLRFGCRPEAATKQDIKEMEERILAEIRQANASALSAELKPLLDRAIARNVRLQAIEALTPKTKETE
jgi:hypothetical protein